MFLSSFCSLGTSTPLVKSFEWASRPNADCPLRGPHQVHTWGKKKITAKSFREFILKDRQKTHLI